MKPSTAFNSAPPSRRVSLASHGESGVHDDGTASQQRPTHHTITTSKSPRSVHFSTAAPDDAADERGSHSSSVISPSGSFIVMNPDGGDLLSHVAKPTMRREDLPPFSLTREDVEAAFEFLDVNGSGILTMANLKQRLSAFYPQLTSKEYKFLVEDPSGNNGVVGGSQNSPSEPPNTAPTFTSPFAADGPRSHNTGTASKSSPAEPVGPSGGGGAAVVEPPASPESSPNATASRVYGSRAGLDVDQLWDLIHSFQQLQQHIGASAASGVAEPAHRQVASGGTRRHGSPGAFTQSHDAGITASFLHVAGSGNGEDGFDAVGEAFRVYDPRNTHFVEREVLARIMAQIGFGELNEEDLTLLVGTADFDGDGRISLDDFRRLVNMKGRFKKA